jgi:hypothetical protein
MQEGTRMLERTLTGLAQNEAEGMEGTLKPENSQARRQKENYYHPPKDCYFYFYFANVGRQSFIAAVGDLPSAHNSGVCKQGKHTKPAERPAERHSRRVTAKNTSTRSFARH